VGDPQLVEEANEHRALLDQEVLSHGVERQAGTGGRAQRAAHRRAALVRRVPLPQLGRHALIGHRPPLEIAP
jgi:hypothetical protein